MQKPMGPPKGKFLVLTNSLFREWNPEILPEEIFDTLEDAKGYIADTLQEEPGDLFIIVSIEATMWASVRINVSERKGR